METLAAFEARVVAATAGAFSFALLMAAIVMAERLALWLHEASMRRVQRRCVPLLRLALDGDRAAADALTRTPRRHRVPVARLLLLPLVHDRDPGRIVATRILASKLEIGALADEYLRSRRWWRRAMALRALGVIQSANGTAKVIAALDDPNAYVRSAALDALADLADPAALPAIVVRLHDGSLQPGRHAAVLNAYGAECEEFLLDLARVDPEHRAAYAEALAICGTAAARSVLAGWTSDGRAGVREAAFAALGRVGLDDRSASLAVQALDSEVPAVRAAAASALHGWTGTDLAAPVLARHLDDEWTVAATAARTLKSMKEHGRLQLEASAGRPDLAGVLARQMLWEASLR